MFADSQKSIEFCSILSEGSCNLKCLAPRHALETMEAYSTCMYGAPAVSVKFHAELWPLVWHLGCQDRAKTSKSTLVELTPFQA